MRNISFLFLLLCSLAAEAQQSIPLSAAEKRAVIDSIAVQLQRYYVFPDKAKEMGQYLKKRYSTNAYNNIREYKAFVDTLNRDLQQAHTDRHMRLLYSPEQVSHIRKEKSMPQPSAEMLQAMQQAARKTNYGFVKVERLPGNIGYLDFRQFYPVNEESENVVASAMGFLAHSDAIIIDLRKNGGGDPRMVQLIVSYFLDKPVHYNSIYDRTTDSTEHYYALEKVKGQKMPLADLYILTSRGTFSGAEEFAYNMKNLKRATLIGETTGGGAHPTNMYVVNDQVFMAIPFARAINPFTKTNWESVGVEPDIKVEAEKALLIAQLMILEKAVAKAMHPQERKELEWKLENVKAALNPVQLDEKTKAAYTGTYGERVVTLEGSNLYYRRGNQPKRKLIPLAPDLFQLEGVDYFRARFVRNETGEVEKFVGMYDNGEQDESVRTAKAF